MYLTRLTFRYPIVLLYMLQNSEYRVADYIQWLHRTKDFRTVMKRKQLKWTMKIKLLGAIEIVIVVCWLLLIYAMLSFYMLALLLLFALPIVLSYALIIPLLIGEVVIQQPHTRRMTTLARQRIATHPGLKIAVAGSFGKTTAKEILDTVLSEGKRVAATPGNMNTVIGNSRFIMKLDGDEDVVIFELGESRVGDVRELCGLVQPNVGIITGVNEAHLTTFGTIDNTLKTVFELQDYLGKQPVYKNKESLFVRAAIDAHDPLAYDQTGVDGWKAMHIETSIHGLTFELKKGKKTIHVASKLLGVHHVGILSAAAVLAEGVGLKTSEIEAGLKKTKPFEHRMQPYQLHGAWIIDDTYNGNVEGVQVGLELLKNLEAKRRIYVTPGLVEQGKKTKEIHERIGEGIADVADIAVLMRNSTTPYITKGLEDAKFKGKVLVFDDPLDFYANLEYFVARDDVVLMQNDWTDNYE